MNVEYTGRQATITKKLKTQTDAGLDRIQKILGNSTASVHVILTTEKYRHTAELTVQTRSMKLVACCEATDMETALRDALATIEKQAIKQTKRKTTIKRNAKEGVRQVAVASPEEEPIAVMAGVTTKAAATRNGDARKAVSMLVHSFPSKSPLAEPHLVRSRDGVALRPMTLDEAVKEAAFRDRDVFVFRDTGGQAMVLHRRRDGKMELIEVP
jgi:putative sigma-54 modulation protein